MFWKSLAVIFVLAVIGIGYSFLEFRSNLHHVYRAPEPYMQVAPDGSDLIVVAFMDYGCPASKALHMMMKEAAAKDGKIQYIPRPVLVSDDPLARQALLLLYASARQEAFPYINDKLHELWPLKDLTPVIDYAKSIGLDTVLLQKDMELETTKEAIDLNDQYFKEWLFKATPSVLISSKAMDTKAIYIPSKEAPTVEMFLEKFKEAREWF
jgi:protein-disulfide isomerase